MKLKTITEYLFNILIVFSQLLNTILGGTPDETFSSRIYSLDVNHNKYKNIRKLIDLLFWFDEDHCKTSNQAFKQRARERLFLNQGKRYGNRNRQVRRLNKE